MIDRNTINFCTGLILGSFAYAMYQYDKLLYYIVMLPIILAWYIIINGERFE